jgi:hypothetical protein
MNDEIEPTDAEEFMNSPLIKTIKIKGGIKVVVDGDMEIWQPVQGISNDERDGV